MLYVDGARQFAFLRVLQSVLVCTLCLGNLFEDCNQPLRIALDVGLLGTVRTLLINSVLKWKVEFAILH